MFNKALVTLVALKDSYETIKYVLFQLSFPSQNGTESQSRKVIKFTRYGKS